MNSTPPAISINSTKSHVSPLKKLRIEEKSYEKHDNVKEWLRGQNLNHKSNSQQKKG